MKCECGKQSTIKLSYTKRGYCDRCFSRYIEHRVRKDIRLKKPIKPLDVVPLLNDGSKEFIAAKHFLERVFGKNLTVKPVKKKDNKTFIATNMERHLSENFQKFIGKGNKEQLEILDNVLEEEVVEICRILGKKFKRSEKVNPIIEQMELKYPGSKFSLYKSFQQLSSQAASK